MGKSDVAQTGRATIRSALRPRLRYLSLFAGIGLAVALLPGRSQAAVVDLRQALLPDSARPVHLTQGQNDWTKPESASYSKFVPRMHVTFQMSDPRFPNIAHDPRYRYELICTPPKQLKKLGWKQGVIEAFGNGDTSLEGGFRLCGYRLRDNRAAHSGFVAVSHTLRKALKHDEGSPLTRKRIGDESVSFESDTPFGQQFEIVFRVQNAVIDLSYRAGGEALDQPSFLRDARYIATKLTGKP